MMEEDTPAADCECPNHLKSENSILYGLLVNNRGENNRAETHNTTSTTTTTSCRPTTCDGETCRSQLTGTSSPSNIQQQQQQPSIPTRLRLNNAERAHQESARLLLKTVAFVKRLPQFYRLSLEDRITVLCRRWPELLVITMAQNNFQFEVETQPLHLADVTNTLAAERRPAATSVPLKSDVANIEHFVHRFQTIRLDDKEYALLKASVLFSPETYGLEDFKLVENLQSEMQSLLSEYITACYPHEPLRFARILLGLPSLRNVRPLVLVELFFRKLIGSVSMEDILAEMLVQ